MVLLLMYWAVSGSWERFRCYIMVVLDYMNVGFEFMITHQSERWRSSTNVASLREYNIFTWQKKLISSSETSASNPNSAADIYTNIQPVKIRLFSRGLESFTTLLIKEIYQVNKYLIVSKLDNLVSFVSMEFNFLLISVNGGNNSQICTSIFTSCW